MRTCSWRRRSSGVRTSPSGFRYALTEDEQGRLYVGTEDGLFGYVRSEELNALLAELADEAYSA